MSKKLLFIVLLVVASMGLKAQTLQLNTARFDLGPYSLGGHIAVPITAAGCFDVTNQFTLWLSNDNFTSEVQIGTYANFYTTYVNGLIPAGIPTGSNYKVRVKSTNPVLVSTASSAFTINAPLAGGLDTVVVNPINPLRVLKDQLSFGWCSTQTGNPNLALNVATSSGSAITANLCNEVANSCGAASVSGNTINVPMAQAHYTIIVKTTRGGNIGTRAYFLINSPNNLAIATIGEQTGCIPDSLSFKIVVDPTSGGMGNNFPGHTYIVSWGDGTPVTEFRYCDLVASNGFVKHEYTTNSCLQGNGTYPVTLSLNNSFFVANDPGPLGTCARPTVSSSAKIFTKPIAKFTTANTINGQMRACLNTPTTFNNTSSGGNSAGSVTNCTSNAFYFWYVDNILRYSSTTKEPVVDLTHTFTTPGNHTVRLLVDNGSCATHDTTFTVCVETPVTASFTYAGGATSLSGCAPSFTPVNNTLPSQCGDPNFVWRVLDATTMLPVGPTYTTKNPNINVTQSGTFKLQLCVTNSCNVTDCITRDLISIGNANVNFPAAPNKTIRYCSNGGTINFQSNTPHIPTYQSQLGSMESYVWTVTPRATGTFSFINATTANSRFPEIQFNGFDSFLVKVVYQNNCAPKADSQWIVYDQPLTVNAGVDIAVCFNALTVNLNASSTGPRDSLAWSLAPTTTGTLSNRTILNPIYTFSANDKILLKDTMILRGYVRQPSACSNVIDTVIVTINPRNFGADSNFKVCSGTPINYSPVSSVIGSTYTWTSNVIYGTVSGRTINGSGAITDNLVCTTPANDSAVVQYTITPNANSCNGETFIYKVTVFPIPTITVTPNTQSICSFQQTNLGLSSNVPYAKYSWVWAPSVPQVTGGSSQTNQAVTAIQQSLINATTSNQTATYTITANGLNGCNSTTQNATVTIFAAPTIAIAPRDTLLCNVTSYSLTANVPVNGNPTWSQIGNTPNLATGVPVNNSLANLTNLVAGTYQFEYSISSGIMGCPASKDTITIINRPAVTASNAGADTTYCEYDEVLPIVYNLRANGVNPAFETGTWSILSQPDILNHPANLSSNNNPNASLTLTKSGTYVLQWTIRNDGNCPQTTSQITIRVFPKTQRGVITSSNFEVCQNTTATINLINFTGNILKWQVNKKPLSDGIFVDTAVTTSPINFNNVQDTFEVRAIVQSAGVAFGCTVTDTATIRKVNVAPPVIPGTIGADTTICSPTNLGTLCVSGNNGVVDRFIWSNVNASANPPTGSFLTGGGTCFTFTNVPETRWYRAVVQSGACPADTTPARKVTIATNTDVANAGRDTILCSQNTYTLIGNTPSGGNVTWTQTFGNGVTIVSPNNPSTVVNGIIADGNNLTFRYTVSNGICPSTFDDVTIVSLPTISNLINNTPLTICSGQSVTINGSTPTGGNGFTYTYQWQTSLDNITWVDSPFTTSNITFIPSQTMFVRRVVTSGNCNQNSNSVLVTVQAAIANNTIPNKTTVCTGNSAGTIIGSTPTGGNGIYTYLWQSSLTGTGGWTNATGINNTKDYITPSLTDTVFYRRIVTTNLCTGAQQSVSNIDTVVVYEDAKSLFTLKYNTACPPINLDTVATATHFAAGNGAYRWDTVGVSSTATVGTGIIFPSNVIKNFGPDSVIVKLFVASPYGCKADSSTQKIIIQPRPQPNFTMVTPSGTTTFCTSGTISFANTTPFSNLFTYKWEFRNGSPTETFFGTNPPNQNFPGRADFRDSVYKVTLTVYSACDSVKKDTFITVRVKPKSIFSPDKLIACSPAVLTFTNLSVGNNVTYNWHYDSLPATPWFITTSTNPATHTYNVGNKDTVVVKLVALNECGRDSSFSRIIILPRSIALNVQEQVGQQSGCTPHTVNFINNSFGGNNFFWDFNDNPPSTRTTTLNSEIVSYTYTKPGTYIASIRATNNCTDTTVYRTIRVYGTPKPSFTSTVTNLCIGDSVAFTNTTDTATTYLWKFGDGTTSVQANPKKVYLVAGNYTVWLIATRNHAILGGSCIDSISMPIIVTATQPANITTSGNNSNCKPFTVNFTNNTIPNNGVTWVWGDGVLPNGTGNTSSHTYTDTGTYNMNVTVAGLRGCTYTNTQVIRVNGPVGSFVYDKGFICGKNNAVRFTITGAFYDSVRVNFGNNDSITTTSNTFTYSYPIGGRFVPRITFISGANACFYTFNGMDTIKIDYVQAGFTTLQTQACGGTTISFTDTSRSTFGIQSYNWDFGNGPPNSILKNPSRVYTASNIYPIKQIVTSVGGCVDSANISPFIKVNNKPLISSIQRLDTACTNVIVDYRGFVTSVDPVNQYIWRFGNGGSSTGIQTTNVFGTPGIYVDTLIVGTTFGCYDTLRKVIVLNPTPIVTITPATDQVLCLGNSLNLTAAGANNYSWNPIQGLSCTNCFNPSASPTNSTRYFVTGTTTAGCQSMDSIFITVPQPFTISTLPDDSICIGQTTRLGASGAFRYLWSPSAGLSDSSIAAPFANPRVTTLYQVIGFDSYGCFTDTANVLVGVGDYPIVQIGRDTIYSTGSLVPLTPSVLNGPIQTWAWTPSVDLSCSNCPTPTLTVRNNTCINLTATNFYGCAGRDTVCVQAFCTDGQVFIPNAFSPDGDGVNDILMVRGTGIRSVKTFRIFNRWGQAVFDRANFAPNDRNFGWNGKINGQVAPTEVYVYTCEVICENGTIFTYKGNVTVIR